MKTPSPDPENSTKEYITWRSMIWRCANDAQYIKGGVEVCDQWKNYLVFLRDMGRAPSEGHSIDRINPTKGYAPDNCRWATDFEQGQTRTDNRYITHDGRTMILSDWAREFDILPGTLAHRLEAGWDTERALTASPRKRGRNPNAITYVRKCITLPDSLLEQIEAEAAQEGRSVSAQIAWRLTDGSKNEVERRLKQITPAKVY